MTEHKEIFICFNSLEDLRCNLLERHLLLDQSNSFKFENLCHEHLLQQQ